MIPKAQRIKKLEHPILTNPNGSLLIEGYPENYFSGSFGLTAIGPHFRDRGIADNSVLMCSPALKPVDGDIVIVYDGEHPTLHVFRAGAAEGITDGKRTIGDPGKVDAVVLSSFNFYR